MPKVRADRGVPRGMRGTVAWVLPGLASTSAALALLAGACGASPARSDVPPVTDRTCARPSDCSLAWTTDDVCGCCGRPRRGHVEALSSRAATERMSIGCPACDCPEDPTLFATCARSVCEVVDLQTSELTACSTDEECIATPGTCGPAAALVPLRRGAEARLGVALGCSPRPVSIDHGAHARCEAGHCRLVPDADTPVSLEGPGASSLASSGTSGACTLGLGAAEAWRSWQMAVGVDGSPDEFSRVLLRIPLRARCTAPTVVTAEGWLESGAQRHPLHYELRETGSATIRSGAIEPGREVILDLVARDAPFLTALVIRAVVRVRLSSGAEILLSTPELSVRQVS